MASTYSPSLRLELIGDGDQSGIWGQTTNNNLGYLLEQAVAGVITISMADANYTMSNFNGVVDESRNQILVLTGALTAQRNLVAPLVEKTYVVKNTTTGGQSVQIIGSSGIGVVIPNGVAVAVYCDGINFYNAISGIAGNLTVSSNLTVTGNLTVSGTSNIIPAGTRMPFAQAAAPTGFTQVTDDTANNRMLRVINTAGGGTGGAYSPILMNVVPYHTHSFTTGGESANHYHYVAGGTGGQNADHVHYSQANGAPNGPGAGAAYTVYGNDPGYGTSGTSNDHAHYFAANTGYISNGHVHSGGTDGGSSSTNWTPRYIDMIICTKN
jgi:hypothetical protein